MTAAPPFRKNDNVEAVPDATQLAALSFVSAVEGFLATSSVGTRVVLHRSMGRSGLTFIQQASPYAGLKAVDHSRSGRVMDVDRGIVGFALTHKKIARTKGFSSEDELNRAIQESMKKVGDDRDFSFVARSYLAIPMIGSNGEVATLLYADTMTPGLFATDSTVEAVRNMCNGFCKVLDQLEASPFSYIENFPITGGNPMKGRPDVYEDVQELVDALVVPKYEVVTSLNLNAKKY